MATCHMQEWFASPDSQDPLPSPLFSHLKIDTVLSLFEQYNIQGVSPSMLSPLERILQLKTSQYDGMSRHEQLAKLEQILLLYAHGDAHVVEGMKLAYFAIVS